jgi:hypothetical protein
MGTQTYLTRGEMSSQTSDVVCLLQIQFQSPHQLIEAKEKTCFAHWDKIEWSFFLQNEIKLCGVAQREARTAA